MQYMSQYIIGHVAAKEGAVKLVIQTFHNRPVREFKFQSRRQQDGVAKAQCAEQHTFFLLRRKGF